MAAVKTIRSTVQRDDRVSFAIVSEPNTTGVWITTVRRTGKDKRVVYTKSAASYELALLLHTAILSSPGAILP